MALINNNDLTVAPTNITGKFRESFENFTPGVNWNLITGSGDIVQTDGNAVSASYLVISKDPLTPNTETILTYNGSFPMPVESSVGLSMSQRVLGQELAMELVSTETPLAPIPDIAISSIGQNTGTLYVNTTAPHGLVPGKRIGIKGVTSDSRMNYPSLVVSQIVSATQFYCTAGPGGNIPSLTVGPYNNQGLVYFRSALGFAQNGISQIFENTSVTNSSMYARSAAGDALPSGTASGNHSVTVLTTTATQAINSPYTYAFLPASEYRFNLQAERAQFYDAGIDSAASSTSRLLRTQVVPDPAKDYTLRFRMTNVDSLTVPTAKIVSASKSGTTTATVITDVPHGLTTGDYIVTFGTRNGTNFPPIATPQVVASVVSPTSFTVVWGAAATSTSYGGFVAKANGANVPSSFQSAGSGAAIQSVTVLTNSNELSCTSSGNFLFSIGDYVNVYGVREGNTGNDVGVDGVYKVVDVASTATRLAPLSGVTLPASLVSTDCGGAVIKRTDARISFVRIFEYLRERVELMPRPAGDASAAVTVTGSSGLSVAVSSGSISAFTPINTIVTDIASAALTTTATSTAITPTASGSSEFNVIVTAASGTNPTLDVVVQESDDSGTNWYDIYHFPRITATGQYRSPLIPMTGNRVRYVRTVGGTTPSFTHAVNRLVVNTAQPLQRQFIDRNMNPVTLNATTTAFFGEGCVDWSIWLSGFGAFSVAPTLALEGSPDNSTWAQIGADIIPVASTPQFVQASSTQTRFIRMRVKAAGTGASIANITFKGIG